MSRRPPPQDHSASSNDVPTITSPVNPSYPGGILRPPPANRATSEPFGVYDVPASSTTPTARPLKSILTNPNLPPTTPRVRFLIPQSSTEIRDRLAGREGLVDSPGSTASTASRDNASSDSDPEDEEHSRRTRRPNVPETRDLSDIIGRSVRGFVRRNFDRNSRNLEQERDPNRGSVSRGVEEQPYRTRNNGSPAQSDTSSITSPELRRASLAQTGRNSPLQRFGARSINELRGAPTRTGTGDSVASESQPPNAEDLTKAPPRPLAESGRPRPREPIKRKSSDHGSYYGPGQADGYYYGTPAAEQEPGIYYGPPPPKMPTPPPPPAMIPPKYKPGGGSAAEFYNPDNVDPDAAIPIQEGSQFELTILTGANQPMPQAQAQAQAQPQQPGSFFGGPITAEPTSSLPGGFPETPINASAPTSFSTAHSNPSYPPQVPLSYAPPTNAGATSSSSVNVSGGATVTTGTMSAIDAATLAEMAYDQTLANQQRPTSTATPSQVASNLANLPPLPPSTAPTYTSPYAPPPPAINTNVQAVLPYQPLTTMSPVPIQSPVLMAPRPQHPSNIVPAIAAAAVAGGAIGAAVHSSHSHSASISSQTSYSQSTSSYIPAQPSHQPPPPPPPMATVTSPITGKPKPPPKPAKPSILAGILSGGKRPSISSPTVSQSGSAVGGKILATGLVGATAAVATALAGQSSTSSSRPSNLPQLVTNTAVKPPSTSHSIDGKTAAIVAGTAAITVAAAVSHNKEKEKHKQKIANKPSTTSSSSGDGTRIHGLKGKANYNKKSNDIRGVKLPSAMNAFDSASSSDFLFDTESDSDSSSSSHGKKRRNKENREKKGKTRQIEDLSSSHSSMDFGGDDTVGRSRGKGKSYGAVGAATTAAMAIPGVVSDLNHSEDEGSSPRNRPGAHMRKKSTDSDLAFGRSVGSNVSGYTSDSSMYSTGLSPEAGNGFQFWAVRNRSGRRKARRVSSRDSINSVNSALGFGDSSDESKPGSKGWLRKRESLDSNLAFGLSSASTSRRSSYASGLHDKFTIEEEDDEDYDNKGRRKSNHESPTMVKNALENSSAYTAAEASRRKGHDRRPSEGIIVAPGHRLITEEQRMADYERLDRMRTEELKRDIARQKEAAKLSELENDRREKEKFDRERMERRRKEEEFARERQWMIEEDERRGSIQRQVTPFYYYY
ncbi:hypothetical protein TWF281_003109 [Arthrobotrys megalospora]